MDTFTRLMELAGIKVNLLEMSSEQARNVFKFYGVVPADDLETLKTQYRKLAAEHHPDRGGDTSTMQEINSAFEMLKGSLDAPANDSEEIRRQPGSAFEDFRDAEYFARRVEAVSGGQARPCTAYAFDGEKINSAISMNAALADKPLEMIREGMLTQGGSYTAAIGLIFKSEPNRFYVVWNKKDRGNQKVSYITLTGFMVNPATNVALLQNLKSLTK